MAVALHRKAMRLQRPALLQHILTVTECPSEASSCLHCSDSLRAEGAFIGGACLCVAK